ncbi:MAG TPA: hypothetical protein VKD90_16540, partial [Gemmataceae bacterium]|nr:hypothetical protein [Gemmataceae bacterium]
RHRGGAGVTPRLLAAGLAALALGAPAVGQNTLKFEGSEVFRFALHKKNIEPANQAQVGEVIRSPRHSMIIVLGDTSTLHNRVRPDQLRNYVLSGGAVLIATDTRTVPDGGRAGRPYLGWAGVFGVGITGEHLIAPPDQSYGTNLDRPFVQPIAGLGGRRDPSPFDLFDGVPAAGPEAVATDQPSWIIPGVAPPGSFRNDLAEYPRGAQRPGDREPRIERRYSAVSLRANDQIGRMIVLATPSVFANGMLGFKEADNQVGYTFDNGNWAFADRTIEWLKGGGERKWCLFIENGEIKEKFAEELPKPPRPPIPEIPPDVLANILLNHSNGVINELQEKNFFNRAMEGFFGFPRIVRAFLIVATVLFLFYGLRWLARGQRKPERAAATSPAQQAALLPRGGVLRQRTAAQIEVGNLSEATGRRVRDRFDVLGGMPAPGGGMPPVLIAIDVADAPVLRQSVRQLWEIGYGEGPARVLPTEWDRVNALLERVTARAARGDWSFGQDVT